MGYRCGRLFLKNKTFALKILTIEFFNAKGAKVLRESSQRGWFFLPRTTLTLTNKEEKTVRVGSCGSW